jgi:hypothetical protein
MVLGTQGLIYYLHFPTYVRKWLEETITNMVHHHF